MWVMKDFFRNSFLEIRMEIFTLHRFLFSINSYCYMRKKQRMTMCLLFLALEQL